MANKRGLERGAESKSKVCEPPPWGTRSNLFKRDSLDVLWFRVRHTCGRMRIPPRIIMLRFALRLRHFVRGYHIVDVNKLM